MSKQSRRRQRDNKTRRAIPTSAQAPQSDPGSLSPHEQDTSIRNHTPLSESSPKNKQTEPAIGKLAWLVIGAVLAVLGGNAVQALQHWYYSPRLEMRYSISALLTTTNIGTDEYVLNNHALLVDRIFNCNIVAYDTANKSENLQRWGSTSEVFWKILVKNSGRSPLNDVRFSIEDKDPSDPKTEIETTPNLTVDIARTNSTTGINSLVVSIRDIPPNVEGIVTIRRKTDDESLIVHEGFGIPKTYDIKYNAIPIPLQFHGSRELGGNGVLVPIGTIEMLWHESQIYGFENLQVPYVDGAAAYVTRGDSLAFKPGIVFLSFNDCPFPQGSPRTFELGYQVKIKRDDGKSIDIKKAASPSPR